MTKRDPKAIVDCYVCGGCDEAGRMQYLGHETYRCRRHDKDEILAAAKRHQEQKEAAA